MIDCYVKNNCKKYKNNTCNYDDSNPCIRFYKIDYLFKQSLLSDSQRQSKKLLLDSNECDREAFDRLALIKENICSFSAEGKNLYIYSTTPGNGKTSWAIKLLQAYIYKIWPEANLECKVLYVQVPKFLLELKSNISSHSDYIEFISNNILSADIVVWDDIGTKSATEFEHEHLLSLIDSRIFDGKSNIFTSNIEPDNLSSLLGDRLASRIINNSETIKFIGMDKRGLKVDDSVTSN